MDESLRACSRPKNDEGLLKSRKGRFPSLSGLPAGEYSHTPSTSERRWHLDRVGNELVRVDIFVAMQHRQ